jgi:hypothetical protein
MMDWFFSWPLWFKIASAVCGGIVGLWALIQAIEGLHGYYKRHGQRMRLKLSGFHVAHPVVVRAAATLLSVAFLTYAWLMVRKSSNQPTTATATTGMPKMVDYGTQLGTDTRVVLPFAVVDGSRSTDEKVRELIRLILVVRFADSTIDPLDDAMLGKSRPFRIPLRTDRITLPNAGQPGGIRFDPNVFVALDFFLLCVPYTLKPEDFSTISEAQKRGGFVCDRKGLTVTAPPRKQ